MSTVPGERMDGAPAQAALGASTRSALPPLDERADRRASAWHWRAVALGTLRAAYARVRAALPSLRDLHVYGGGLAVAAGAWMAYPPAGPIAIGALLVYLGLRRPAKTERGSA